MNNTLELPIPANSGRGRKADRSPAAPDAPFVNIYQAADLLGHKSPSGIKNHIRQGRLSRVNADSKSGIAYYKREDVLALQQWTLGAYRENLRVQREAIVAAGERACRRCKEVQPLENFPKTSAGTGIGGRAATCRSCDRADARAYCAANREMLRAKFREWWSGLSPERKRKKAADWRAKNRARLRSTNRTYWRRHAKHLNQNRVELRRIRIAIQEGKTSPILRRLGVGFALVVNPRGEWRAARLGLPLESGELSMAEYERINGVWEIDLPYVVSRKARRITAWCIAEEEKTIAKAKAQAPA